MNDHDQDREMRLANFEKQMRLCSEIRNFIIKQTRITDRELLELAAKAAGIKYTIKDGVFVDHGNKNEPPIPWNPLDDDGDALRLAAKLFLHIRVNESHNGDPYAATRRAIVRAAAEIGRAMK